MASDTLRSSAAGRDYFERVEGNVIIDGKTTADPEMLRTSYLRQLVTIGNRLELSGIDRKAAGQDVDTCLNLDAIYTALLTFSTEKSDDLQDRRPETGDQRVSALNQANRHKHLVLLGDPGSGKSTFLKFLAICLAGELLAEPHVNLDLLTTSLIDDRDTDDSIPQVWEHGALLPVRVILRNFAAKGLPPKGQPATARHLWDFLVTTLEDALLEDYAPYLQQHLQEQGGLILLDGLDEVPDASVRRLQIKQAVEGFADLFPHCRILVAGRTYAYQRQDWRLNGFEETRLAPFTEGQIRCFVDRWYAYMIRVRGMDRDTAMGQAELLKKAIFHSSRLQDFAERPLLLTLMASLHAWRGGSLPEKRSELYEEATELLLDWWETAKISRDAEGRMSIVQPSLKEVLHVGQDCVQQALQALAFEAHQGQSALEGAADIPEGALIGKLLEFGRNKDLKPGRLIEYLSDRAGLLIAPGHQIYTFPHRTFQEYLAARYLAGEQNYPDNIADLARQDPNRWREVLLLAAASVANAGPMIWLLVDALCFENDAGPQTTEADAWGALLAGQALLETTELTQLHPRNQRKLDRVTHWLTLLLSGEAPFDPSTHSGHRAVQGKPSALPVVERVLAGKLLAQLGDSRPGVGLRTDSLPDIAWCRVPAGAFQMGEGSRQHQVEMSEFQIARYPVTNAQYQAFVADGGYTETWEACWPDEWDWKQKKNITSPETFSGEFAFANHPVVGVSWYEAVAFCHWLTLRLHAVGALGDDEELRLPSEAEWEKAARGDDGRTFPWGNDEISPELANYSKTALGATSPVGCFPKGKSPYACEEMSGNVWEWCVDLYDRNAYMSHDRADPIYADDSIYLESGSGRVGRGGAWHDDAERCRAAFRDFWHPAYRGVSVGFRLLRTPL